MKKYFSVLAAVTLSLMGCTTMKAIEETGDQLSQGNILTGLWTGTMGVAIGAIVDVFTLGGSMDAEQSTQMWSGAAHQYAAAKQPATNAYTPPPPAVVPAVGSITYPSAANTYPSPSSGTPSHIGQNASPSSSSPSVSHDAPSGREAVRQCAAVELYKGVWKVMNRCQERVFVAFCYVNPDPDSWARSLRCDQEQYGLAGPIDPGHNETISSPGSRANVDYRSRAFTCATVRGKMFTAKLSNQGMSGQCR
ncbi:MAG: hypothetical protein QM772_17685 [Ottowia sp.]|uniref:hypothetical protein n=1 Tax=Ottowia sp. TaxID=1898956 RepID=UPI0039E55899